MNKILYAGGFFMYKKAKVIVIKTFGNEDLQKILKRILKDNLRSAQVTVSNNLRGDS